MKFLILPLFFFTVSFMGCASSSEMRLGSEPADPGGNPHPGTYGPDTFTVRKWQKTRPATSGDFFFKKCSVMDGKSFWSKTSYDCSRL